MDVEMDEDVEEIEAEPRPTVPALALGPMKIRKNYVPSLRRGPQAAEVMLQCQLCEREIPASEFEEHIRVELIDPKWKEQKLVYERKIRDTNLVQEGIDIARYLKQMASHRADIFGSESKGEQEGLDGAEGQKIMWDGYSSTAGQATRRARENMTEEERAIAVRRKKGHLDPRDPSLSIGPQLGPPTAKRHKN
ncbi:Pre-mRNA splicing factor PRP21 like protein-domain-containing protein [Coemansia spiralis]|nr:Pre-mRNA splicing factor PRP21 like protein-domain-containing protein [Coemansia spiralis]